MSAILGQLVFYLPSLAAHAVALTVAVLLRTRHRAAALLLGSGTLAQLLASLLSFASTALAIQGSLDGVDPSLWLGVAGTLASLTRAAGELVVVGAVWVAVRDGTAPAGKDPYGF